MQNNSKPQSIDVLLVEDESKLANVLIKFLEQSSLQVHWLNSGSRVVTWVKANKPKIVLLDIMLPDVDGLSICREIRRFSTVPIFMITAQVSEVDRIVGLEIGADDYICKPYFPREVVARVKARLRRCEQNTEHRKDSSDNKLEVQGCILDAKTYKASLDGIELELTPVEFRLLFTLVRYPDRVYSRGQLMDSVYSDGRIVSDRTVDSHIKNLRQKLASIAPEKQLVHAVYGVGYRFLK